MAERATADEESFGARLGRRRVEGRVEGRRQKKKIKKKTKRKHSFKFYCPVLLRKLQTEQFFSLLSISQSSHEGEKKGETYAHIEEKGPVNIHLQSLDLRFGEELRPKKSIRYEANNTDGLHLNSNNTSPSFRPFAI